MTVEVGPETFKFKNQADCQAELLVPAGIKCFI